VREEGGVAVAHRRNPVSLERQSLRLIHHLADAAEQDDAGKDGVDELRTPVLAQDRVAQRGHQAGGADDAEVVDDEGDPHHTQPLLPVDPRARRRDTEHTHLQERPFQPTDRQETHWPGSCANQRGEVVSSG